MSTQPDPGKAPESHWYSKSPDAAEPCFEQMLSEAQAEERALWNLHCLLQKQLVEIFHPDYKALLAAARDRLRDPTE